MEKNINEDFKEDSFEKNFKVDDVLESNNEDFNVEIVTVDSLADVLISRDLNEIEYEDRGRRIYLSRGIRDIRNFSDENCDVMQRKNVSVTACDQGNKKEKVIFGEIVRSPMVGTAYISSQPGSAPFVRVGDTVNSGQTLLIIEAMKVLNTIKSPKSGIVKEIYFYDQKPIEYDEALLLIE